MVIENFLEENRFFLNFGGESEISAEIAAFSEHRPGTPLL